MTNNYKSNVGFTIRYAIFMIFSVLLLFSHQSVLGIKSTSYYATTRVIARRGGSSSSSSSTNNKDDNNNNNKTPLVGLDADPFVSAAPLIVAAVCSDGIILAAIHTIFHDEPLLLLGGDEDNTHDGDDNDDDEIKNAKSSSSTTTNIIKDLPRGYRGPYRINSIDSWGTALMSTGWRADTHILTDYARNVASEELEIFGDSSSSSSTLGYGEILSNDISSWMAQCSVSDQTRSLSCVGLLATITSACGNSDDNKNTKGRGGGGYLWLIDGTGSYRVRAHAVGSSINAGFVNDKLQTIDWTQYTKDEGAKKLVTLLSKELLDNNRIPSESCIELAYISSSSSSSSGSTGKSRKLERLFTSRLFGISSS